MKRPYATMDGQKTAIVPCGKCILCLKRRSSGWTFRLLQEAKDSLSVKFLTFTYDDDHLPFSELGFPTLNKQHLTLFFKRLRKRLVDGHLSYGYRYKRDVPKIKYYAVGEYGSKTYRPHYHAIMYNIPNMLFAGELIQDCWQQGNVQIDEGNTATMTYVTKYIMKSTFQTPFNLVDEDTGEVFEDDRVKQYSVMSKRLGMKFLTPQMLKYLQENEQSYVNLSSGKISLPRYYREKTFTKDERKKMAELSAEYRELNPRFDSAQQEHQWKQDQIRKQKKDLVLSRQML